jgi:hypothetical protein
MKRSDFPVPFTTCLLDLNSEAAYADYGMPMRKYPRISPVPYGSVAEGNHMLLEPWRKNMKFYPQVFFLVSHDVPQKDPEACKDAVLGIGIGLATSDDGVIQSSKDPAVRDRFMCYWYSLFSDGSQVLGQEMKAGIDARDLVLTIESPTLGKHVFDQKNLQFAPQELLDGMNKMIAYKKYDLFSLGAAGKPVFVAQDQKFLPDEVITIACPGFETLEITVDDQRDPEVFMRGWKPSEYFLEPGYEE